MLLWSDLAINTSIPLRKSGWQEAVVMNNNIKRVVVSGFFLLLLLVGTVLFRDYGISWDEPYSRMNGGVTVKHIGERFAPFLLTHNVKNYPDLKEYGDSDYGVAFEAPAVILEGLLDLKDERDVYLFRHLLTFLMFLGGVFAVYRLASRRFEDWRIGLLTALFLVLTPRFFAESFYNSKDIVFMAAFAIAMNTMIEFVLKPGVKTALFHAFATAFAVDVRIVAVILIPGTIAILLVKMAKKELPLLKKLPHLSIYSVATCVLIVAMWPWLWNDPITNFIQAFYNMSQFRWRGDIRYMGGFVSTTQLPWHYLLVWISITTPLLYIGLFVLGFASTVREVVKNRIRLWSNDAELQDIVFLTLFLTPILSVILLQSILYDGWRQLYFIYPALLLIATKGWVLLWDARRAITYKRIALCSITIISVVYSVFWIWKAHPIQNVYFNMLAGDGLRNRFELDYWGVGNRKALEYILAQDQSQTINIWPDCQTPLEHSFKMLKSEERARLKIANDGSTLSYVLTNYRGVKEIDDAKYSPGFQLFYQVKFDDEVILSVYKRIDTP
jgi:Dolichyl-phosphate-mannose-protein mannosyltransferase